MNSISFLPEAWKQYKYWVNTDKQMLKRLNKLIDEGTRSPFEGIGKPEPLKGNYTGWWSRRIDHEHRLVYRVKDDMLIIAQCRFHYDD